MLISLPPYMGENPAELDFSDPYRNLLFAVGFGHDTDRFKLSPIEINIRYDPDICISDATRLPVVLEFEFLVRLNLTRLASPISEISYLSAEAQRRLLSYLLPRSETPICRGDTNTARSFISCLHPAPSIPSHAIEAWIQHPDLKVQLLPFQRRSVYWMLEREGMTMGKHGVVIPKSVIAPESDIFWKRIEAPFGESVRILLGLIRELIISI
jgi:hypothetical protein